VALQNFPETTVILMQTLFAQRRESKRLRTRERERGRESEGEFFGLTNGGQHELFGAEIIVIKVVEKRQIKEKVKFGLYVG